MSKTKKVTRIDALTPEQSARFDEWADRWIEIGLRTAPADRPKFEAAAKKCYDYAEIPWHGNVVWVSSPLVMAFAAPTAAFLISLIKKDGHGDAVDGAVHDAVDGAVGGAVHGAVGDAVDGAVGGAVRDAVDDAVHGAVHGAVGGSVSKSAIQKAVMECIEKMWPNYLGGQFWAGGWYWGGAYTSFFREVGNLDLNGDLWRRGIAYEETIQSACWWYPHKDFLMVCERPRQIHRELIDPARPRGWGSHRLHSDTGRAVSWGDGWGIYSIHGVRVTQQIVEAPETLTVHQIETEQNAEVRRIMIDRYGPKKYLSDSGAIVVQECKADHYLIGLRSARLLRKEVPDDEPIVMVDLLNSTPEPDGSVKRYLLRVDPSAYDGEASRDCLAAVASTWRNADGSLAFKRPQDYHCVFES